MDFYARYAVAQRQFPVIGLLSPEKLLGIAQFAGLSNGSHVIEFGCGYGEDLLHLSEAGQIACAEAVVAAVKWQLKTHQTDA